jgi:hypothetical protein
MFADSRVGGTVQGPACSRVIGVTIYSCQSMQDGLQRRDDGRDLDYDNNMMSEGRKR